MVSETSELQPLRQDLVDKLVQALESDAAWVELYGVTGELVVPGVTPGDDQLGAGLRQTMEVCSTSIAATTFLTVCLRDSTLSGRRSRSGNGGK